MKNTLHSRRAGLITLVMAMLLSACGQEEAPEQAGGGEEHPPRPVEVTEIARQDIDLEKSYSAMLRSDSEVTLVARVNGTLEARHFEPGAQVEEGDSLYTIEPDVYEAVVRQREADLKSAQAEESRAQRDAERFERLLSQNSVSRQQYDQAQAELSVASAAVAQAEAALASAQIDLGYTDVTAPVSGLIGLSEVNVGNLVNSGTELTTITPLDPMEVRFQLPQRDAFELRRQLRQDDTTPITALLEFPALSGGEPVTLEGELDFLGSRVSQGTSTVQASALFENPDALFLPGQFVRVRLEGMKRFDVLAVPEIAVTQGLMGPQVFVLDENDTARSRTVQLGEVAGPWQIIQDGLDEGDRVMVGDPAGIEPGARIEPRSFDGDAEELVEDIEKERDEEQAEEMEQADEAMQAEAPGGPEGAEEE